LDPVQYITPSGIAFDKTFVGCEKVKDVVVHFNQQQGSGELSCLQAVYDCFVIAGSALLCAGYRGLFAAGP
jgi:hypothetical protein